MTLAEKCFFVAKFGDVPYAARQRLLNFAANSPASGNLIGGALVGVFQDGQFSLQVRGRSPLDS